MMARVASSAPPPAWQVWSTLLVSVVTAVLVVWFAAKVFKIGAAHARQAAELRRRCQVGADGLTSARPRSRCRSCAAIQRRRVAQAVDEAPSRVGADAEARLRPEERRAPRATVRRIALESQLQNNCDSAARSSASSGYARAAAACKAAMVSRDRFTRVAAGGRLPSSLPCQSMSSRSRCADSCTSASRNSIPSYSHVAMPGRRESFRAWLSAPGRLGAARRFGNRGILRPVVPRVAAAHVLADFGIGSLPEGRQIARDLHRSLRRRQQLEGHRHLAGREPRGRQRRRTPPADARRRPARAHRGSRCGCVSRWAR